MLPTIPALISLLVLLASTAILYQQHRNSQFSPPRRFILWAATFAAAAILLVQLDAEPWAYLLIGAGGTLYFTTTTLHSKYQRISPKSSRAGTFAGKNRRERRRER